MMRLISEADIPSSGINTTEEAMDFHRYWPLKSNLAELFLTGTPGPGAHYHVDNVDLSSWQVEVFVISLYKNIIPIDLI